MYSSSSWISIGYMVNPLPCVNSNQSENEAVENVAHEGIPLDTTENVHKSMSPGGSKHDHADSLAPSPKPFNGFSILERFQEFISTGQAMIFGMKGREKDYTRIITSMGYHNSFK
ncbi:hypothetical protein Tco_1076824 [Tanacetum coccineum]